MENEKSSKINKMETNNTYMSMKPAIFSNGIVVYSFRYDLKWKKIISLSYTSILVITDRK